MRVYRILPQHRLNVQTCILRRQRRIAEGQRQRLIRLAAEKQLTRRVRQREFCRIAPARQEERLSAHSIQFPHGLEGKADTIRRAAQEKLRRNRHHAVETARVILHPQPCDADDALRHVRVGLRGVGEAGRIGHQHRRFGREAESVKRTEHVVTIRRPEHPLVSAIDGQAEQVGALPHAVGVQAAGFRPVEQVRGAENREFAAVEVQHHDVRGGFGVIEHLRVAVSPGDVRQKERIGAGERFAAVAGNH